MWQDDVTFAHCSGGEFWEMGVLAEWSLGLGVEACSYFDSPSPPSSCCSFCFFLINISELEQVCEEVSESIPGLV